MDAKRWQKLQDLYQAVLQQKPEQRSDFLVSACGDDGDLRHDLEALLAQGEVPGPEEVTRTLAISGARLGPYVIQSQLGAGGMGVVYRARDERLNRDVALKVLPSGFLASEEARERFHREARALSQLNHPHICTIYDVGEGGEKYIAMEYVEGRPLNAIVREGPLPPETVAYYGAQIADALEHAHERGLLHRDLKASNIMITPAGQVKVLDFGLAKRMAGSEGATPESVMTETGMIVGTVAYMAPELLRGRAADVRSDIWSLGAVLYEMASGTRPFGGTTAFSLTSAILTESPAALPDKVPPSLRSVISRCLSKESGQRYPHAGEVRALLESGQPQRSPARTRGIRRREVVTGAFAIAAAILALKFDSVKKLFSGGTADINSLAVLPLDNISRNAGEDYFADGMTEQMITDLSKIHALRVISRGSVMPYKGAQKAPSEVGRELNVGAVLQGSAMHSDGRVRINLRLIRSSDGATLWAETYERDERDVLALQDEVAREIATQIRITLTPQELDWLKSGRSIEPEVFQLYLRGRYAANQYSEESVLRGIDFYQQALQRDPSYAQAHAGLSLAYSTLSSVYQAPQGVMPKAKAAAQRALELDEELSEAHTALATVLLHYEWDWDGAERELRRAIDLNPSSTDAHLLYGRYFADLQEFDQAIAELEKARQLDPLSLAVQVFRLDTLIASGDYDRAIEESAKAIKTQPNFAWGYAWQGMAYALTDRLPEAVASIQRANELEPSYTMRHFLAVVKAAAGDTQGAQAILAQLEEESRHRYVCAYEIAGVHMQLGETDEAFKWLRKGIDEHSDCMARLEMERWMDPLRSDPRYPALAAQMGFPK